MPYNPWVLLKYKCHINVKFVGSFHTIKYKYVHKGVNIGTFTIKNKDELSRYINGRMIDVY